MAVIFWDASGLAKRYTEEAGRATVNALFTVAASRDMFVTPLGYAETYSILLRKRNSGVLNSRAFEAATNALRAEVLGDPDFGLLSITDALIFGSLSLMGAHNINSVDACLLATYLRFQRTTAEPCLLVASDKRLLRAAEAEGLNGLNPEEIVPGDVPRALARGEE
ncbi:MAG: type II toxin-antitoxin system VapC family toxin [Armatimonadota bacterium]|nr:type II toxin-antitoxin system VapC family toxin [Armatimonadota bacterium]